MVNNIYIRVIEIIKYDILIIYIYKIRKKYCLVLVFIIYIYMLLIFI